MPVELVSFSAKFIDDKIVLQWNTASESNNFGFEIQKSNDAAIFKKIGFVPGIGTTTKPNSYNFIDTDISFGTCYYRLKQLDLDGSYKYSNIITIEVGVPQQFELSQNYPNPFNPETTIKYTIAKGGKVSLVIFDIHGREVKKLMEEHKKAGYYAMKWDGRDNNGNHVSSGIYFCRMFGEEFNQTKKLILIK